MCVSRRPGRRRQRGSGRISAAWKKASTASGPACTRRGAQARERQMRKPPCAAPRRAAAAARARAHRVCAARARRARATSSAAICFEVALQVREPRADGARGELGPQPRQTLIDRRPHWGEAHELREAATLRGRDQLVHAETLPARATRRLRLDVGRHAEVDHERAGAGRLEPGEHVLIEQPLTAACGQHQRAARRRLRGENHRATATRRPPSGPAPRHSLPCD